MVMELCLNEILSFVGVYVFFCNFMFLLFIILFYLVLFSTKTQTVFILIRMHLVMLLKLFSIFPKSYKNKNCIDPRTCVCVCLFLILAFSYTI